MWLRANDEVDHIIYDNFTLGYWVRAFVLTRVWFYDVPNARMLCYSHTDCALPRSVRELPRSYVFIPWSVCPRMLCYSQTDCALPRNVRELPPFICLRPRVSAHECFNLFMQPEIRIEVSRDVEECTV